MMNQIKLERIYTKPPDLSGYRMLVDRLWPRGVSKVNAHLDEWDKEMGPTNELRHWFDHVAERYPEFKARYIQELEANPKLPAFLADIKEHLKAGDVIFLFGAKDTEHNQAVVLKEFVEKQLLEA